MTHHESDATAAAILVLLARVADLEVVVARLLATIPERCPRRR